MLSIFVCIYIVIGSCFLIQHHHEVALKSWPSTINTGLKWIITWPWWAFRR
jgi:hypothetical protein